MKKTFGFILAFLLFSPASVFCAAPTARLYTYNANRSSFLAEKLAAGRPVTYCVYISEAGQHVTDRQDFEDYVKLAFKLWLAYPAKAIRDAGREEEFYPVLNALEREPNLVLLPECDISPYPQKYLNLLVPRPSDGVQTADVSFFFEDTFFAKMNGVDKIAPHYTFTPVPRVVIPTRFDKNHSNPNTLKNGTDLSARFVDLRNRILAAPNSDFEEMSRLLPELDALLEKFGDNQKSLFYSLLHEIGHSIGLADQRSSSLDNSDIIYATVQPRTSAMDNWTTRLTCDDADGMILLFDDALHISRTDFSSLCNDGIKFSDGKESFKGEKKNQYRSQNEEMERTYYEDTKDTGVYLFEKNNYVNTSSQEESAAVLDLFDRSQMPKGEGGYQYQKGLMKIVDFNDPENQRVPIGKHVSRITLGPLSMHRQVLTEEYDQDGNLLYYTLEIYKYDKLIKTKTVQGKRATKR